MSCPSAERPAILAGGSREKPLPSGRGVVTDDGPFFTSSRSEMTRNRVASGNAGVKLSLGEEVVWGLKPPVFAANFV